jgi:hypothetical protein
MPFDVMFPEKTKEMKRMVLDYIKILRRDYFQSADHIPANGLQKNALQIDASGFPIAPRPQSWADVTKADLEPIFRLYIKRHYRMSRIIPSAFLVTT